MRLIDAAPLECALLEAKEFSPTLCGRPIIEVTDMVEMIRAVPTVDAVPVRRGRWVKDGDGLPVCPFCDKVAMQRLHCNMLHESWLYDIRLEKTPYCPNCGAYLREGSETE